MEILELTWQRVVVADTDLLDQLRLDHNQRDPQTVSRHGLAWISAGVLLLLLLLAAGGWWWSQEIPKVRVAEVVAPTASNPGAVLQASGYVTARRAATVSAQVTGRLTEVHVEEGERVRKGQLLARLDGAQAQAALVLAKAQVAAARAGLGQYQANAELARLTLQREQQLVQRGLAPKQTLDQALANERSTAAAWASARDQIKVAVARQREAEVAYDYTFVRAPFAGVITDKAAQVGEIVSPFSAGGGFTRTGVATIVDMNSLEVDVDVNEAYLHRVFPGQPAEAVLNAYPNWTIPAHVIAIVPTADKSKATVKVRVALEQKDPRILPDMGVRVNFLASGVKAGTPPKGLLIPKDAVVRSGGHPSVFVVLKDGRVRLVPVVLGHTYQGMQRVRTGLQVGNRVIRNPPSGLANGSRVRVTMNSGQ